MQAIQILDNEQVIQKINRIMYQLIEDYYKEDELIFAGITGRGFILADEIVKRLAQASSLKTRLIELPIDKKNPYEQPVLHKMSVEELTGKTVFVVDDVLNSGKTLLFGVRQFLHMPLKKLATIVLIDRDHKRYPVSADYSGLTLATTLQQNITVFFEKGNFRVILE